MVGSAIVRQLLANGHDPKCIITRTHQELDLTKMLRVELQHLLKGQEAAHDVLARLDAVDAQDQFLVSNQIPKLLPLLGHLGRHDRRLL